MAAMIERDVAIVVCSRGREAVLTRLLDDLERAFVPALAAGGLSHCIWVYAQGYAPEFLAGLERRFGAAVAAETLVVSAATRPHARIGDVVDTAIRTVHDGGRYKLAMLMDDDSVYAPHPAVDANIARAARTFIAHGHRAYSIKLGASCALEYQPFVDLAGPIMPFKEKMLWVSRAVLDEVLLTPRFREISIGEDAVIAAVAWLGDPGTCFGVYGMGTFLHLGYEAAPEFGEGDIAGGYAELMNYDGPRPEAVHGKYDEALRTGVTPYHVMPDVFVAEDHPHYIYNGIRAEVIARLRAAGRLEKPSGSI
ncbi:MAG TPA: hypothetical protein VHN20_16315 [Beijerinckiaceae bacterium]|nr:hypothetical protein [Beijerinckiaceae bacterium]